jgi:hypothetical protein
MKRFVASLIITILVLTAPGLSCYAAAGAIINPGLATSSPIGMQVSASGIATVNLLSNISVGLSAVGLKSTLAPVTGVPIPMAQGSVLPLAAPSIKIDGAESVPMAVVGSVKKPASAPKLGELLGKKEQFTLSVDQVGSMSAGEAKTSAASIMDRILGIRSAVETFEGAVVAPQSAQARSGLAPSRVETSAQCPTSLPAVPKIQAAVVRGAQNARAGLKEVFNLVTFREAHDPPIWSALAAAAVLLPVPMVGSIAFHELGHFLAGRLMGARANVRFLDFSSGGFGGYVQQTTTMRQQSPLTYIFISLSGPAFGWIYRAGFLAAALAVGFWSFPMVAYAFFISLFELVKVFGGTHEDYFRAAGYLRMARYSHTWNILFNPVSREEMERISLAYGITPADTLMLALRLLDAASKISDAGRITISTPGQDELVFQLPESKPDRKSGRVKGKNLILRFGQLDDDIGISLSDGPTLERLQAARSRLGISTSNALNWALALLDAVRPRLRDDGTVNIRGREPTPTVVDLSAPAPIWRSPTRSP